ncbi:MAG: SDR family oxidoreductase [Rhodospirillales bacterium]|nr:SDR family oxidoreductase [Rhodospirillales bacterium]
MAGRLEGKAAIVVGAGSTGPGWGNGKAAAVLFAREGARVLCADIDPDAAAETAAIVGSEGGEASACVCDAGNPDGIAAMTAACLQRYGRIDVLENNVGVLQLGGPAEVELDDWERLLRINLTSMFLACKAVLPVMVRQFEESGRGGVIVNIASIAGIRDTGIPFVAYNTTKGAILPFTRSIAIQYAKQGIRANSVLPGLMQTPMVMQSLQESYGGDAESLVQQRNALCPTGAMGDAWDVAYAALYLASDEAKYVTAAELVVDGGITARIGAAGPSGDR